MLLGSWWYLFNDYSYLLSFTYIFRTEPFYLRVEFSSKNNSYINWKKNKYNVKENIANALQILRYYCTILFNIVSGDCMIKEIFFFDPEGNVNASIARCISWIMLSLFYSWESPIIWWVQISTVLSDIFAVSDHHDMLYWDCNYLEIPCLSAKKVHLCLKV